MGLITFSNGISREILDYVSVYEMQGDLQSAINRLKTIADDYSKKYDNIYLDVCGGDSDLEFKIIGEKKMTEAEITQQNNDTKQLAANRLRLLEEQLDIWPA